MAELTLSSPPAWMSIERRTAPLPAGPYMFTPKADPESIVGTFLEDEHLARASKYDFLVNQSYHKTSPYEMLVGWPCSTEAKLMKNNWRNSIHHFQLCMTMEYWDGVSYVLYANNHRATSSLGHMAARCNWMNTWLTSTGQSCPLLIGRGGQSRRQGGFVGCDPLWALPRNKPKCIMGCIKTHNCDLVASNWTPYVMNISQNVLLFLNVIK